MTFWCERSAETSKHGKKIKGNKHRKRKCEGKQTSEKCDQLIEPNEHDEVMKSIPQVRFKKQVIS